MTSTDMRVRVLLSVQRTLLGHIGTAVRAIMCRWTKDEIHVRAVFDGEINDEHAEAISEAETEIIADFPSQVAVCFKLERCDYPALIQHEIDEVAVFRRMEK
ncbi:hypothetical protein [Duganella phyllosphaerae]|uniref:hypothetical protein n=1 Tax=Duganella phyllosphaerae TaxID=762836 RepID=UPI00087430B1|nr:hypothetical protein [Duganella phyllosphaerae]